MRSCSQAFEDLDVRQDGVWNGISYNGIWVMGAKSVITLAERSLCAPEQFTQFDLDDVLVPRAHEMLNELRDDPARPGSCDAGAFLVPRAFADAELGLAIEEPWKNRDMTGPRASFASTGLGTAWASTASGRATRPSAASTPRCALVLRGDGELRPWYYAAMAVRRVHPNKDFSAMAISWLGRAYVAIEQASRRWRGGRREGKILISTQVRASSSPSPRRSSRARPVAPTRRRSGTTAVAHARPAPTASPACAASPAAPRRRPARRPASRPSPWARASTTTSTAACTP